MIFFKNILNISHYCFDRVSLCILSFNMTTVIIPYLVMLYLGRTIDLTTYKKDIYHTIYDDKDIEMTPHHVFNSTYTVLQENVIPYSHMGLPADIVIRIKSDDLHTASGNNGLDGWLKQTDWKSNSVVIAVTTVVEAFRLEIKKDAQLRQNWLKRTKSNFTHYVHAQMYGGWSIILYRLKCEHNGQEEEVRKLFTSIMGVSGQMDEKALDLWEKALAALNQNVDLKDKVNVEMQVYSTVKLIEDSIEDSSPDSILKAVKKFSEDIYRIKLHLPLYSELKPLNDLNDTFPVVTPDQEQEEFFLKLDKMIDDVKFTKASMRRWTIRTHRYFTEEEAEKRIRNLRNHVDRCVDLFQSIVRNASIYKPVDKALIDSAYYLYRNCLDKGNCEIGSYSQLLLQLKEEIDPGCMDYFNSEITGNLEVEDNEKIEAGEMQDGLEGCKALCLQESKCRSIRYAEKEPVTEVDPENHSMAILTLKLKQCWLLFRSSRTARVVTEGFSHSNIYDRYCYGTEFK